MKTIFRLLCGWMAIALTTACSHEELLQTEPVQKPVAQKTISVKAYTPSEQAATRLAFEDKGEDGLKLSWTAGDIFTAVIGGEKVMFAYNESSKEFTAIVNESVTLTDGLKAYYPAYDGESFEMDLSQQTGALNSATTYMEGAYDATAQAFRFTHSTAILKVAFSGLPQNAVISSIAVSGGVNVTISNPNATISKDSIYINLPAIPKDGQLKFMVETATRDVYTATKTVTAEEGIQTGVYYNTTVELQEACLLPTGGAFYDAIRAVDGYKNATSIVFEANVADEAPATRSDSNYTIALAGNVLTISTPLSEFVFNKDCNLMFSYLTNIQSIDFGNCVNTANVIDMGNMFNTCSALTSLDLSSFNTERVINMSYMFQDCSSLTSLNVSSFNTSNVMFMHYMFNNCSSLTSLDLSSFDTANVTDMYNMFDGCTKLTSLNLSSFNTAKVTSMGSMFSGCSALTSLDLSNFNTEKVTNMGFMFYKCSSLKSLNLSSFNTSNVEIMISMFYNCSSLESLDLSRFNTAKVEAMSHMFDSCSALESLDLSSFNTEKVTSMSNLFSDCYSLTSLDLSSFDFSLVTDFEYMFDYLGSSATNKPIPIYVTQAGYDILKNKKTYHTYCNFQYVDKDGNPYSNLR